MVPRNRWKLPKMGVGIDLPKYAQYISFALIRLARPRILHGPRRVFFLHRNGTEDHEQPRSVPLRSSPFSLGRVKTRPYNTPTRLESRVITLNQSDSN